MDLSVLETSVISLLCCVITYLITYLNRRKDKEEQKHIIERVTSIEQAIDSDIENDYYVICPTCSTRIQLNKVKIFIEKKAKQEEKTNASIK
nr:MAG TPA: protein of unknown function (DUF1922) [Herelleviridae sp.]